MRRFITFAVGGVMLAAALTVPATAAQASVPTAPYNVFTIEENSNGYYQVDSVTGSADGSGFRLSGTDEWGNHDSINLAPPAGSQLSVGTYALAGGTPDATHAILDITVGSSGGCSNGSGSITIDQITRDGSQNVTAFAATYSFGCGIQQTQYGVLRYNSSLGFVAASEDSYSVDFGQHYLGEFTPATMTITNSGSQTLILGQMQKTGLQTSAFGITADTCSGQSIAAGATCVITVNPRPTAPGIGLLNIQIPDNSPLGVRYGTFSYQAEYSQIGTYRYSGTVRILDTRHGTGAAKHVVAAGQTIALQVAGHGNVPATGVSAVVLNLTATNTRSNGYLTVYPHGTSRPTVSNLNYAAGRTRANSVTVALGSTGAVDIYNGSAGTVDIIIDSSGYFVGQNNMLGGGAYHPITSGRILDTRTDTGALPAGYEIMIPFSFNHPGGPDIDSHVSAVAFNITAVGPTTTGYLSTDGDNTSVLNFAKGQTVPNMAILHTDHCMSSQCLNMPYIVIYNGQTTGKTEVLVDVIGYYDDGSMTNGLRFHAVSPIRIADTRSRFGAAPIGAGKTATITAPGSLTDDETYAVALNVTAISPTATTYLTVWPNGARPSTSTLNPAAKQTVANGTITLLSGSNTFNVFNAAGTTNLCVDVAGTYELYPYSPVESDLTAPTTSALPIPVIASGHSVVKPIR